MEKKVKHRTSEIHFMASLGGNWLSVGIDIPDIECHSAKRVNFWTPEDHGYDSHHLYDDVESLLEILKAT